MKNFLEKIPYSSENTKKEQRMNGGQLETSQFVDFDISF